jgi:type I restriction enzyme S subunit
MMIHYGSVAFIEFGEAQERSIIKIIDGDRGKNYPKKNEMSKTGHCLFLNTGNIKNDCFDLTSCDFISKKKDLILRKGKLKRKDSVLTTRGTVGSVAFFNRNVDIEHIRINSGMVIIRPCVSIQPEYLYEVLKSPIVKQQYSLFSSGAAQPQLPIKDLKRIKFPLPPLPTQKKIAAVLSAYDDLIENNNRRIAILGKMAEEIYREWFVRMRFPGHEKVKFHKGVPEGGKVEKVNKLGKIITGKTPSTKVSKYYNGNYLFIKTPDMHGNMFVFETEETLTEEGLKSQPSQTIPKNSVCVSCIGTGGVVSITTGTCQTNQQINTLVLRKESDLEWAFFTLRNLKETIRLFGATGTTMTNLSKGKFSSMITLQKV